MFFLLLGLALSVQVHDTRVENFKARFLLRLYLKAAMEAECLCLKQDQLVQFCTQMHSHFSLLFSPPSLSLSRNSPPREPINAKDDDDDDEAEEGECMSMAQENSCTGTRTNYTSKDQPNPEKKSPIANILR